MQRNPHSYQIATGYRTFYSLSLIYQPITKKRLFFIKEYTYLFRVVAKVFTLEDYFIKVSAFLGRQFANSDRKIRVIPVFSFVIAA